MSLIKKFYSFLKHIFLCFTKSPTESDSTMPIEEDTLENLEEVTTAKNEDRINAAKRTLMTRLYILEQEITVFEDDFPKEYQTFMEKIECLRESYNSTLKEIEKQLTFEIDPELDWGKTGEVLKLENDIKTFIEKEVKFNIISKRLQRLITKLNILYNVSILHSKECEKEKAMSQLKIALESATELAHEFKQCNYILGDKQLKERIVNLISYADYEILKVGIRNSNQTPEELIQNLVIITEFDEFDYSSAFTAFIKDELTDLGGLLTLITDERCREALRKKIKKLLTELTYSDCTENQLFDTDFWNNFLALESCLFEMLKVSGVEKEKIKVSLIVRMDISIDENDVVVLPITNAYLSLTSLYSITQDNKILALIKLLSNVSKNVTYKEIYFLLLLFDAIGVVTNTPNELIRYIERYVKKYPYDGNTIMKKKEYLMHSSSKEYVVVFVLNGYEKEIVTILENLNIDFKVKGDNVFINSFYFIGLENVLNSLQNNTRNMMI